MSTEKARIHVPALRAGLDGIGASARMADVRVAQRSAGDRPRSWLCPVGPAKGGIAETQVGLRRIYAPTEQSKKKCGQTDECGKSRKALQKPAPRRWLCGRLHHAAQARRAGQPIILVRHAFATERSSAVGTTGRRFAKRMEQTAGMAQARRGGKAGGGSWCVRSH